VEQSFFFFFFFLPFVHPTVDLGGFFSFSVISFQARSQGPALSVLFFSLPVFPGFAGFLVVVP